MTQTPSQSEIEPLELRVLAGRVRGANAPLDRGQTVVVGYDLDADIVLRDASAKGIRLTLKTRGDAADLDLIEGQVDLLGHTLTAPAKAVLPTYMPLLIGTNAIAIGVADSPRWPEAERILVAATRPAEDDDDDDGTDPVGPPQWQYMLNGANALVSRSSRFVPAALIAVVAVCALSAMATGIPVFTNQPPKPEKVEASLSKAGFTDLEVTQGENGRLTVSGMLATDEDRNKLRQTIAENEWPARVNVQTYDGIARGVEDFYLANGMEASARSTGAGLVRLDIRGGTPEQVDALEPIALKEVKGLRRLEVSMLPGADDGGDFEDVQEGGGKRVVSVVGGETGHVTTADGSRYFPGAILPTGHKIVSIEETRVLVERNGAQSELKF